MSGRARGGNGSLEPVPPEHKPAPTRTCLLVPGVRFTSPSGHLTDPSAAHGTADKATGDYVRHGTTSLFAGAGGRHRQGQRRLLPAAHPHGAL